MPDESALVEFVRQLFAAADDAAPMLTTRTFTLRRYRDGVFLAPAKEWVPPASQVIAPGQWIEIAGVGRTGLDAGGSADNGNTVAAAGELVIDFRRGGERCRPVGRPHSVSLKQWLQESGVPPWWRDRIPLLKKAGQIVCIGDLWECTDALKEPGDPGWKLQWERNSTPGSD
jgi:tRNA(Ile)-lysidine synthase